MIQNSLDHSVPNTVTVFNRAARATDDCEREKQQDEFLTENSEGDDRHAIWSQVCSTYYQPALELARRRVGNSEDAFEIIQDSCVRLLRLLPDHKRIDDGRNYWLKTVSNQCFDRLKQRQLATRIVTLEALSDDDDDNNLTAIDPPDTGRNPEMNAEINEESERLLAELKSHCHDLTYRERALLTLHIAGFSSEQIAHACRENVKVVRVDMNALLAKIRYRVQHMRRDTRGGVIQDLDLSITDRESQTDLRKL